MNASPAARRKSVRWNAADVAKVRQHSPVTANVTANTPASSCAASFATAGKRGKYRNQPVIVDGIRFASKAEARRYGTLKLMADAGAIRDLRLQTSWPLKIGETLICRYRCDFEYWSSDGRQIVEDVKGALTPAYRIKKKLMAAIHGVEIQEIMSCAT